jgi:ABC-type protease/lipase transport system fused ATPase/permease subunit
LYGDPKIVVLDEPNSNLDEEGEACLLRAVAGLKQTGATVVLVTHKINGLSITDTILVMQDGQIALCGARQEVLNTLAELQSKQREQVARFRQLQEEREQGSGEPPAPASESAIKPVGADTEAVNA